MTHPAIAYSGGAGWPARGPDRSTLVVGASDLDCGSGHVSVPRGVTLDVAAGEVVVLLAANGQTIGRETARDGTR